MLPAQAQIAAVPADMAGEWHGVIEGFQEQLSLEPRRNLAITPAGCVWQEVGKAAFISNCALQGRVLQLTTPASASVRLQRDGDALRGTFTVKGGRKFGLTMWRTSDLAVGWHDSPTSSEVSPPLPSTRSEKTAVATTAPNEESRLEQLFPGTSPSANKGAASEVRPAITTQGAVAAVCRKHFPRGVSYSGKMRGKSLAGDVTDDVRWDMATCGAGQFTSGRPAIVISGDWWVNGRVTQRGWSSYYGLDGQVMVWIANRDNPSIVRKSVITLQDEASFLLYRQYVTYDTSTTMTRR